MLFVTSRSKCIYSRFVWRYFPGGRDITTEQCFFTIKNMNYIIIVSFKVVCEIAPYFLVTTVLNCFQWANQQFVTLIVFTRCIENVQRHTLITLNSVKLLWNWWQQYKSAFIKNNVSLLSSKWFSFTQNY